MSSEWMPVTSGVLGPVLFVIYINGIAFGFNNFITKFADDTKIGNITLLEQDRRSIQEDLLKLPDWSEKWEMPFNINVRFFRLNLKIERWTTKYAELRLIKSVQLAKDLGVSLV